jgi:gas vesicle protein
MKKKIIKDKIGGKLLGGALIGTALGVVAGILVASDSGKKIGKDLKRLSGEFYRYIAPQLKKMRQVGEVEYRALIARSVDNFVKTKKVSISEGKILAQEARRSWSHIKKNLN